MAIERARTLRGAAAGAVGAAAWALQQPLDKRVFRSRYDDVELLGRAVTGERPGGGWYPIGFALHVQNGALFGAVYASVAPRLPVPASARGVTTALAEHVAFWPLGRLSDRWHPARGTLPRLTGNRRAFWQAAWRHLLFGALLGELERRWNAERRAPAAPDMTGRASTNGHGNPRHATAAADASG